MKARVGDRLVRDGGDSRRACEIIGLHHADGSPPYVVRWLSDGHIALLYPGPYMRLIRRRGGRPADRKGKAAGVPTAGEAADGRERAKAAPARRRAPNPFLARTLAAPRPHGAT